MTRLLADQMLAGKVELDDTQAELVTTEYMSVLAYADTLGVTDDALLDGLTSAQWTRQRARRVVEAAQAKVQTLLRDGKK